VTADLPGAILGAAVPGLQSAEQLPTVRGVRRFSVLAPDGRTVRVSVDSPEAVTIFRELALLPAIRWGVGELLAAGSHGRHGFIVQPAAAGRLADRIVAGGCPPAEVARLLQPVARALSALHAGGLCFAATAVPAISLVPAIAGTAIAGTAIAGSAGTGAAGSMPTAVLDDLLPVVPLGSRIAPGAWDRFAGAVPSAPELRDGGPLTAATDVFGLAVVVATLLTGSTAWTADPAAALLAAGACAAALRTALAIDPAGRRITVEELYLALADQPAASLADQPAAENSAGYQTPAVLELPPPPPVRSRLAAPVEAPGRQLVEHRSSTVGGADLPEWQREIAQAAMLLWGDFDNTGAPVDRPELRYRAASSFEQLVADPVRPMWRSPVLVCSVLATLVVLVVAVALMLRT